MSPRKKDFDPLDDLSKSFMQGYENIKQRVLELEGAIENKDKEIASLNEEIEKLRTSIKDFKKEATLWRETAENRKILYDEYVNRERSAFDMIVKTIVDYVEKNELYKSTTQKYANEIIRGFKGMSDEQKELYKEFIESNISQVKSYAEKIRKGKGSKK